MDKSEKDSALTTSSRSLEDGVEQCLMFHAEHMGLEARMEQDLGDPGLKMAMSRYEPDHYIEKYILRIGE